MALVKLSAIVDNISGKLGNVVFSRTKGGLALRNYNYYRGNTFPRFDNWRWVAGSAASRWFRLSERQRQKWEHFATTFPYQNRLGDTEYYSGYSLFIKLNFWKALLGLPYIISPRQAPVHAEITDFRISRLTTSQLRIEGSVTLKGSRVYQLIHVSHPQTEGKMRNYDWLFLTAIRRDVSGPFFENLGSMYLAEFPRLRAGQKVFVKSTFLDEFSGVTYGSRIDSAIV